MTPEDRDALTTLVEYLRRNSLSSLTMDQKIAALTTLRELLKETEQSEAAIRAGYPPVERSHFGRDAIRIPDTNTLVSLSWNKVSAGLAVELHDDEGRFLVSTTLLSVGADGLWLNDSLSGHDWGIALEGSAIKINRPEQQPPRAAVSRDDVAAVENVMRAYEINRGPGDYGSLAWALHLLLDRIKVAQTARVSDWASHHKAIADIANKNLSARGILPQTAALASKEIANAATAYLKAALAECEQP